MQPLIVVKVGTNVLTRENQRLNYNRISDLVSQIAVLHLKKKYRIIFVSSGAAGAGREKFEFRDEKDPIIRKQMLASIGQGRLFQIYSDFFIEHSLITAQALLTRNDFKNKISYRNVKNTLSGLLNNGIVPIINENDVVSDQEFGFGDNDQLAALTAALMEADSLIILSDIDGFYTADPKKDPEAELIKEVAEISDDLLARCEDTLSLGGTGGMYSKIKAAELATQHGIPTIVTSGKETDCLLKVMKDRFTGTKFLAKKRKKLSTEGTWMTTSAHIAGSVTIDQGAEQALSNNKSLLAVGVTSSQGNFKKGDVILVQDQKGIRLGAGLAKLDSSSLDETLKTKETRGIIVIHKNNLYTL